MDRMFTQDDVHIVAAQFQSAPIKKVAGKAGVSKLTIYRFFQKQNIGLQNREQIYCAVLTVIQKDKSRAQKIQEKRTRILNQATA